MKQLPLPTVIKLYLAVLLTVQCVSGQQSQTAARPNADDTLRTVFIIQSYYHTGMTIELDKETLDKLECAKQFSSYRYIDIGWGEEVFYQDPEFTLSKAARAIFTPSSSVVRVEGFNRDIRNVIAWSDRAIKITITTDQFIKLCEFINDSLIKDNGGGLITASTHGNGSIIFFKSPHTYHLFNTCNTWIARALRHAGLDVSPAGVVTAATLFRRLKNKGEPLKNI